MNLKKNIKKLLKEETDKFELVKNFIYTMFDNVSDVEYIAKRNEIMVYYKGKPFLRPTEICDTIKDYTGLNVFPYYEYNKNNVGIWDPDFYLDVEEYDEELNENYSPAGKEITPNKIVIHKSNPKFRDRISNEGLKAIAGECYKIYAGYGEKCIPAIFATNSTNKRAWFDSTYDDDVWTINTELIPNVKWYKDRHFDSTKKHIVTFDNIPPEAIELMREGTGDDMIRESNDKLIKETKTFQEILNKTLNEIKNICELPDIDTFPDWLSFDDCDVVDTIDKITIVNIEKRNGISTIPMFEIDVNLELNGIWGGIDYEDFMYSISSRITNKWRIHFIFNIIEQNNINKREMWESVKHKNINKSKFFHRRVDLNDVEKLLPINSRQIFYETESYEQFKYEITLRAVESIMYNEYGMGYEDLPEQEEIDFVTEVSNIFEDIIKDTYDYFNNL